MERRNKIVAGLTVAAVVLIVAGIAAVAIDSGLNGGGPTGFVGTVTPGNGSHTATPSGSVIRPSGPINTAAPPTPSPSPVPSPSRRPAGFAYYGASLVYFTTDGTIVPVPAVAGLRVALVNGHALYYARAGNRYNLVTGSYAGEFRPDVTMQREDGSSAQTGGLVLVGPAVARMIADKLTSFAESADHWIVALPVDIRTTNQRVDVTFDSFGLHGWSDTPRVLVRFTGTLPVVNDIPGNYGYHVLVEQLGVTAWQIVDPLRLSLSPTKLDPDHLMNELLIYGNGAASTRKDVLVNRRVAVGQPMVSVTDEVSVSLVVKDSRSDIDPSRILSVGDVPVFVASS